MKKGIRIIISLLIVSLIMFSCDLFYDPQHDVTPDNSNYYVRYTIKATYPYLFSDVTYRDVYGTEIALKNYRTRSWSVTIGPVKKGFNAYVKNESGSATNQIEISKNGEPFTLKANGTNSASYTIDF
ncbi:MAG: hypothetical protein IJP45_06495 [Paludibacteraceae bacterium]|nr:hypothetical protein [Paludibacteraceae bacterium]MBQ4508543.1 hypothetical protein [Paludibacteraceae bacterium]MBQ6764820.1 hypothetical protein [Paludibacteraceae bacterium]